MREGTPAELTGGSSRDRDPLPARRRGRRRADERADAAAARADRGGARAGRGARRARGAPADARGRLPRADRGDRRPARARDTVRLFLHELRTEQLLFWRNREAAFFTFFLPVIFFLIFGVGLRQRPDQEGASRPGGVVPRGGDDRLRRRRDVLRRARDHARRPARVGDPEADPRDAAAAGRLPARRARLDVHRLPDRGGADHRDRPAALLGRRSGPAALAPRRARARRALLRGDGPRRHRARALLGGLLGGDQRDLPADGDHLGHVLHAEDLPGVPARDRRRAAAHALHAADPGRDGAAATSSGRTAARSWSSRPGARSASPARSAASAGSRSRARALGRKSPPPISGAVGAPSLPRPSRG